MVRLVNDNGSPEVQCLELRLNATLPERFDANNKLQVKEAPWVDSLKSPGLRRHLGLCSKTIIRIMAPNQNAVNRILMIKVLL